MANQLKRRIKLVGILASMFMLLVNYQNCAPPAIQQTEYSDQMRTGDDWSQSKLLFVIPNQIFAETDPDITLHGICNRVGDNGILSYSVSVSETGLEVESGIEDNFCEGGGFRLDIQDVASLDCNLSYQVHIQSSLGYEDLMFISKSCN